MKCLKKLIFFHFNVAIFSALAAGTCVASQTLDQRVMKFEKGLRPALYLQGTTPPRWTIEERMAHYKIPGMSLAIIENGAVVFAKGYGTKAANEAALVDTKTVFNVASLSKVGTAATILSLVAKDTLTLNVPVNKYLKTWQIADTSYTKDYPVTLRGIMAHTAGLTVHGFPDINPGERLPTLLNTLNGTAPAQTDAVINDYMPGTRWRYSGGGTTVLELLIEDVSGSTFTAAAKSGVFDKLGMKRTTFQSPLPKSFGNIAKAHDEKGQVTALPRGWQTFPQSAAAGLWSTPTDFATLMISFMDSYQGEKGAFLPQYLAQDMMTEVGISPFGLGPLLDGSGVKRRFSHGGANGSYKAWMEGHLETKSGIVIFTNVVAGYELLVEIRHAIADAFSWPFYQTINIPRLTTAPATLNPLVGNYQFPLTSPNATERYFTRTPATDKTIAFTLTDGQLWLGKNLLTPTGPLQFIMKDRFWTKDFYTISSESTRVQFTRGLDGNIKGVTFSTLDSYIEFSKITS